MYSSLEREKYLGHVVQSMVKLSLDRKQTKLKKEP